MGENEKESDQFLECPPCNEGAEIKRALRWSSEPLGVPAEQRAVNLSREAIRRAQESDEICKLIKKELSGEAEIQITPIEFIAPRAQSERREASVAARGGGYQENGHVRHQCGQYRVQYSIGYSFYFKHI